MKKCSRCKKEKPFEAFNFRKKSSLIRQKSCKECTRLEIRNHYLKNKNYYLLKAKKRNNKNREIVKKFVWKFLLMHPCIDCGEKDPIVLDFDHQRDKVKELSAFIKNSSSLKKVEDEISKCEVRCANCHRRKTARDFEWYKHKYALVA